MLCYLVSAECTALGSQQVVTTASVCHIPCWRRHGTVHFSDDAQLSCIRSRGK